MCLLNKLAKRTNDCRSDFADIKRFSEYSKSEYRFVAVGSGPTIFDIDSHVFDNDILNLGQAPQTLHYSKLLIDEYKAKFAKNAIIIIIIMCPFFFGNNLAIHKKHYSNKYYYLLSGHRREQILKYKRYKAFAADHNMPFLLYGTGLKGMIQKRFKQNKETKKEKTINDDAHLMNYIWKKEFDLENFEDSSQYKAHEEVAQQKIQSLLDLLDNLKKQSFRPICVVPPLSFPVKSLFGKEFLNCFFFNNLNLIKKNGYSVLDYHDCGIEDSMFKTSMFLNESGAKRFSEKLFFDINTLLNGR